MNSLLSYGSDDDCDDSSEEKQTDWRGSGPPSKERASTAKETDANYEEVQMDLSEESNDSSSTNAKPETAKEAGRRSRERDSRERGRHEREREEYRGRSSRDRDRERERKDDRYSHRRDRDRKSRRSDSRERRRSRTPPRRTDREPKRSRSRSRSRDRSRKYTKRYERRGKSPEKFESQKPEPDEKRATNNESDRFFMPGITGRFRDQIERRKQLWQKKDNTMPENKNGQSKKVWETTTFAQDTDGKVANKFKRLMGIKGSSGSTGQAVDTLKKQEEMFSSMEQQYEVARTATHTMRGVGLGFGSYQR